MTRNPLTSEERKQGGFTDRFVVNYADLQVSTGAGTALTLTLAPLAAGQQVGRVSARMTQVFTSADGTFVSCALTIGDDGSGTQFMTAQELNLLGTEVFNKAGTNTNAKAYDAANNLKATFTPTAGKALSTLSSQGSVTIFAEIIDLAQLAGA